MLDWLVMVLVLWWVCWWVRERWRSAGGAPCPPGGLPLLGHLLLLRGYSTRPYLGLTDLVRRYGPILRLRLGTVNTIVLADPKLIRTALAREEFTGRADLFLTHGIMQGYGLIVAEGERWREQRRFVLQWLKQTGMVKVGPRRQELEDRITLELRNAFSMIEEGAVGGVDVGKVLLHCLGNVLNMMVLGRRWEVDDPTWLWLQELAHKGTNLIGIAGPLNLFPFLRWLPKYRRTVEYIMEGKAKTHEVYRRVVWEEGPPGEGSLASDFLKEMQSGASKASFTEQQLYHLVADIWGAGVDTTLATLRWLLLFLSIHPEIQEKMYQELRGTVTGEGPTLEDLASLPYTEACIAETQRIRPVVPLGIPHAATVDTELAGYKVAKGTMLLPLQWAVHMDPSAWKNPETFDPTRFLSDEGRFVKPDHFIPFQTGKRVCVGEEMARMMLSLFGAGLVYRYQISLWVGPHLDTIDLQGDCGITLTPPNHNLVFFPRDNPPPHSFSKILPSSSVRRKRSVAIDSI